MSAPGLLALVFLIIARADACTCVGTPSVQHALGALPRGKSIWSSPRNSQQRITGSMPISSGTDGLTSWNRARVCCSPWRDVLPAAIHPVRQLPHNW